MRKQTDMSYTLIILIFCSILLASIGQILLRAGMSHPVVQFTLQSSDMIAVLKAVSTTPGVIGGLALYGASAVAWLLVLARLEVSLAYPFVGVSMILTMFLAHWVHGETLSTAKVTGTLLIALGIAVIAHR